MKAPAKKAAAKTKAAPKRSRRAPSAAMEKRRLCIRTAWKDGERVARTEARKYVPFMTPGQFITEVRERLVPEWRMQSLVFYGFPQDGKMFMQFGSEADGTEHRVTVKLRAEDVSVMAVYLFGQGATLLTMVWRPKEETDDDGDGGDKLSVPTVSQAMLSRMPSVTTA